LIAGSNSISAATPPRAFEVSVKFRCRASIADYDKIIVLAAFAAGAAVLAIQT
jgi:hypothetical protein